MVVTVGPALVVLGLRMVWAAMVVLVAGVVMVSPVPMAIRLVVTVAMAGVAVPAVMAAWPGPAGLPVPMVPVGSVVMVARVVRVRLVGLVPTALRPVSMALRVLLVVPAGMPASVALVGSGAMASRLPAVVMASRVSVVMVVAVVPGWPVLMVMLRAWMVFAVVMVGLGVPVAWVV
ncbi:hypothetical protein MSEN_39750 [Mycolicibacter senuensis]|uniref:Uncharacterized protein n=1 Tax=Mycolicibacter senuensis TaxID=386913 RepID=A0A7I9XQI4_9MYCO|nr:hypothetical protein MSEN_39750 [Mycolicibacter senuensis]